jgi:hypothetical protein
MFRSRLVAIKLKHLNKKCIQLSTYDIYNCYLTGIYKYLYNLIITKFCTWQRQFEQYLACIKIIPPGIFLINFKKMPGGFCFSRFWKLVVVDI